MATDRLTALGYTLRSWALRASARGVYLCWILPRWAWLRYTGRIPPAQGEGKP